MHLDSKDDNATSAGDEIGHYQVVILDKKTLYPKAEQPIAIEMKPGKEMPSVLRVRIV